MVSDYIPLYTECTRIIQLIDEGHFYCMQQNDFQFNIRLARINGSLSDIVNLLQNFTELSCCISDISSIVEVIVGAQENKDIVLINDTLVNKLKIFIIELLNRLREKGCYLDIKDSINEYGGNYLELIRDVTVPDDYILQETPVGIYTIQIRGNNNIYLHSSIDPYLESLQVAETFYRQSNVLEEYGTKRIAIYGLGLGYHIQRLSEYRDICEIVVFESDINIIKIALQYISLPCFIEDKRVRIIYDRNLNEFSHIMKDNEYNILVYRPSMINIRDAELRQAVNEYYVSSSSIAGQLPNLVGNFTDNIRLNDEPVSVIRQEFIGKRLFLIAGGPSLDEDMELLNNIYINRSNNDIFMCVGTVYRKLVNQNIIPDYVIITDSQKGMISQVQGVECSNTALIYLSTVASEVAAEWRGKRYIVFQNGFEQAVKYVESMQVKNCDLIETGGSVSTTAFDIGLRYNSRMIITLGLDLAFYNNLNHASDTRSCRIVDVNSIGIFVDGVMGRRFATSMNLNIYRKWLEKRIAARDATEGKTRLINCSKGAIINGMEHMNLEKAIKL